jgi:hypothetical protein
MLYNCLSILFLLRWLKAISPVNQDIIALEKFKLWGKNLAAPQEETDRV